MNSFPLSKIDPHQAINTILWAVVAFFMSQFYFQSMEDHKTVEKHETRITVLEQTGKQECYVPGQIIEAILPKELEIEQK